MTTERIGPPVTGDERTMLRAFLDYHRATLALKCDGLTDEQLRLRSMPPSTLTLLGLVRHMAEVERTWFRRVINGEDIPLVWSDSGDYQQAYDPTGSTRAEAFDAWQREVEHSRRIERDAESLDVTGYRDAGQCSALRAGVKARVGGPPRLGRVLGWSVLLLDVLA
ncbi:Mini-circle protein [Micromonospora sp. S4605]|uniref:mycothiol transferase n=1 Tax=Micromonospora sp. S4605 TaxID=1420897 RepID=UPI000D6F05ED|nr:DUF664 domain-containing protein [Micromonospora sp. S4605]PWU57472.1 Mini-circle protein [Micromonospora sp. S4605]